MSLSISIFQLPHGEGLPLPQQGSSLAAGFDLRAALTEGHAVVMKPGERRLIPSGFAMAIPEGYEGQIRPRSGLALKQGVTVLNAPGTIDADYRGEVQVLLINHGAEPFTIQRGDRIAQLIIASFHTIQWNSVRSAAALSDTTRGSQGYGSTGKD
ncbi:MAG: dUTP diphosphatase [Holophagaceae bacterium]